MGIPVIIDAVRTPIGRYGGSAQDVRADDLGALVIRSLLERNPVGPERMDGVILGCANQAGRIAAMWRGCRCCWPGCR